jgi:hypothetical protein
VRADILGQMSSYPTPAFRRTALAPGILAAIVLFAGFALLDSDAFLFIRFAVAILALIVAVYAWQAAQPWWLIGLVPIVILWNPVFPITLPVAELWLGMQYVAALIFIVAGIRIKVPNPDDRNRR